MKQCNVCKQILELNKFNKAKAKKDGLCGTCKECSKKRNKKWYDKQKDDVLPVINNAKDKCVVCEENRLPCLDLHHKNPKEKEFGLSRYKSRTIEEIKLEIDKCVCLCNNCHRKYHAGIIKQIW